MKRFLTRQRGFTLIELLVVIAILGILAVVIIPNVASFIGSGTVEAANTESAGVQLSVVAYMAAYNLSTFDGDVGPTPGTSPCPGDYMLNQANLQAVYTFAAGAIDSATKVTDSKWGDLLYTAGIGWHEPTP